MPASHTQHPGYAKRRQLRAETKLLFQRHLDSQRETRGIKLSKGWCILSELPARLGIRMVSTTERGRGTLEAMAVRPMIDVWLNCMHHEWKACLENGDIKAVLAKKEDLAPKPRHIGLDYPDRVRFKGRSKLALQRHLDSQRETRGIKLPRYWCILSQLRELGIRMVSTTERGRGTLKAMAERPMIDVWLRCMHDEWKACLENGDIKAVLVKKDDPAPKPHTMRPDYAKRVRMKEESKLALQRHLDSQRETRGIKLPGRWGMSRTALKNLGIRMVATTARGLQTLEAVAARPGVGTWRRGTHDDWKTCLEYGDIRAVITGKEGHAAEEEEAVCEEEEFVCEEGEAVCEEEEAVCEEEEAVREEVSTRRTTRKQVHSAAMARARAARTAKARRWTAGGERTTGSEGATGGERTTGGGETNPRAKTATRRAISEEVMRRAMSEELTEGEDDAEVKVEDGEVVGCMGLRAALVPNAERVDENNITDRPEHEERRSKRLRMTQGNQQIGFGLVQNRTQFPPPQNGSPQTDYEAHTEAARSQRCTFSVEIPVLIHDTIVVGGQIGSGASQPFGQSPSSPPQRPNKRSRREDTEVQRDRQIEAAHQDANAIVDALRTIRSELSAVVMASRAAPVPADGPNLAEVRLIALEQGQRRLEGMMVEMLGHVRPSSQL